MIRRINEKLLNEDFEDESDKNVDEILSTLANVKDSIDDIRINFESSLKDYKYKKVIKSYIKKMYDIQNDIQAIRNNMFDYQDTSILPELKED